jgi:hypothetical protein
MCDYSLHLVTTRPAKVADKLITTRFNISTTRGFAEVGEPNVAVCVRPGTEIAFENDVEYYDVWGSSLGHKLGQKIARFRQLNQDPLAHHDALEFPDGQIVLLTRLCEGQHAYCNYQPLYLRRMWWTRRTAIQSWHILAVNVGEAKRWH